MPGKLVLWVHPRTGIVMDAGEKRVWSPTDQEIIGAVNQWLTEKRQKTKPNGSDVGKGLKTSLLILMSILIVWGLVATGLAAVVSSATASQVESLPANSIWFTSPTSLHVISGTTVQWDLETNGPSFAGTSACTPGSWYFSVYPNMTSTGSWQCSQTNATQFSYTYVSSTPYVVPVAGAVCFSSASCPGASVFTNISVDTRLRVNVTLSANDTKTGVPVTVGTSIHGGVSPAQDSYLWSLNGSTYSPAGNSSSFIYTPAGSGNYTFSVNVTDPWGQQASNRTGLQVLPPSQTPKPLTANVTLSSYAVEAWTQVTAFASVRNGTASSYAWSLNGTSPLSCSGSHCNVTLVHSANYGINATVVDTKGRSASSQAALSVTSPPKVSVGIKLSANNTRPGTLVWTNATASGGIGYLTYSWELNGSNIGGNQTSLAFVPKGSGNYSFTVAATDIHGESGNARTVLMVLPNKTVLPPVKVSMNLSANNTYPGENLWINATASGGDGSFGYVWTLNGTAMVDITQDISFLPKGAGNYSFGVQVSDLHGQSAANHTLLTVLHNQSSVPTPLEVTVSTNTTQITAGQSIKLKANGSGGTSPYNYLWSLNGTNTTQTGTPWLVTLAHAGNYTYGAWVQDVYGDKASSNTVTVVVLPRTSSAPVITSFIAVPSTITLGKWTNFTVTASSEAKILSYSYQGLPKGCSSTDLPTVPCDPSQIGTFEVTVRISGPTGHATATTNLTVSPIKPTGEQTTGQLSLGTVLAIGGATVGLMAILGAIIFRRRRKADDKKTNAELPPSAPPVTEWPTLVPPVMSSTESTSVGTPDTKSNTPEWDESGLTNVKTDFPQIEVERTIGEERKEENPFGGQIRPEDVNPNVRHVDPQLLQPMELRVTENRGANIRDTSAKSPDQRAEELMEKANRTRTRSKLNSKPK